MGCPRGKASPNAHTKLRLFADSAGYCQNPSCLERLFVDTGEKNIHIAEMAHVFSASDDGPRGDTQLTAEQRGSYENLILLCANCHTTIDKAEEDYSDELILEWKYNHTLKIANLFGVTTCESRRDARNMIEPIFQENSAIFDAYGPMGEARFNPESDIPELWLIKVRSHILPNNRKILAILDANREYMSSDEVSVLEIYRQHVDDFESKHIGEYYVGGVQFPAKLSKILEN